MASGTRLARLRMLEDDNVSKRKTRKLKKFCGARPRNPAEPLEQRKMTTALKGKEIATAESTAKESAGTIVTTDISATIYRISAEIEKLKTALAASEQQHKAELDELKKQLESTQASSSNELINEEQKLLETKHRIIKMDECLETGFAIFRDAALSHISDPAVRPILEQLEYNMAVDEFLAD